MWPTFPSIIRGLYWSIAITLPVSVRLYVGSIDLEVIFPAELLIALLGIAVLLGFVFRKGWRVVHVPALRDPVVLVAASWIIIMALSVMVSDHPIVSMKALLVRSSFIVLFFLVPSIFPSLVRIDRYGLLFAHAMAFVVIIVFSLVKQSETGFDRSSAALAPFPFYVDHTSYSAVLVFVFVLFLVGIRIARRGRAHRLPVDLMILAGMAIVAFLFAYCRAAWIGAIAMGVLILARARNVTFGGFMRWMGVLCIPITILATLVVNGGGGQFADSNSTGAGFKESVLSLTNIHSDASNKERINRWKCSLRMFADAPVLGHGVGTYQFVFPPYQRPEEMTYISVSGPLGSSRVEGVWEFEDWVMVRRNPQNHYCSGGTAHSEYFLALAESGLGAGILFLVFAVVVLRMGFRSAARIAPGSRRWKYMGLWLAVMAYFVHALFNNFLDDPKVAFPFWTTIGLLVSWSLRADRGAYDHGIGVVNHK
ncbi:MAG: O-antigen ligase family protein [Flavobacteriales bacterium]|nr:O-antigen ligase family protein [Flavobacteriales bacterium]